MKKHITLCFFFLFSTLSLFSQVIDAGMEWDGENRFYRIVIPSGYVEGDALPVVLNFHGFGSNGYEQQLYSGMDQVAEENNFIVVYPHGIDNSWNVGWAFGTTTDDVGFANAMIDSLHANYGIDLDRVYSTGMSNGGFFSYRLACELNERIAKIASVTGSMAPSQVNQCMPENPIPVMQIHGTADAVVNYNGTAGVSISIENLLEDWRDHNSCVSFSDTIVVEDIDMGDGSTAELIQYRDCADDVYMAFYKVFDGAHTWPGATLTLDITNRDFNASKEIWRFFDDQYPIDNLVDTEDLSIVNQKISLFPNPTTSSLTIKSSKENIESIQIFDPLGRLVYSRNNLNLPVFQINNIQWKKGFYFVQTKTESTLKTARIIKN